MDQELIWNRAAVEFRPHLYRNCAKFCMTMDAERLAMIGALVQQPKPTCTERHSRFTAKEMLATAKPTLKQLRLQQCTAKPTTVFSIFFPFCAR